MKDLPMINLLGLPVESWARTYYQTLQLTQRLLGKNLINTPNQMIFEHLRSNVAVDDDTFNEVYPYQIKRLAKRHWTPVAVAKIAAAYLAERPDTKVMDIGSGAGKFCLVGATCTQGMFYGIEQRGHLIEIPKN